jgi:uncharacterized protein YbaR (Trm112 family)
MHRDTLDFLRCPYCGGRLQLVDSMFHEEDGDRIESGILGCHCCIFPVVNGIPVLHLGSSATTARDHIEAGRTSLALRAMVGLDDHHQAEAFEATIARPAATYQDVVAALGPTFEGGYFLYRFSDPTFIVADAVVQAVAGSVLQGSRRAVDVCGGSGHLTRSLLGCSSLPPVVADLYFAKLWLARRYTAPTSEPVCCDGNAPLPFARGAFGFAMCSDAFQYIWTKRQFIAELSRLVDDGRAGGAVVINHTHNQLTWSPSHGQPLTPLGYRDLFESLEPRIFGERGLFDSVVTGGPLDLTRVDSGETLESDPALTIVAAREIGTISFRHPIKIPRTVTGRFRVNPLYVRDRPAGQEDHGKVELTLRFPSVDYEDEYGACRRYLPDRIGIPRAMLAHLESGIVTSEAEADLVRRRIVVDLPLNYC